MKTNFSSKNNFNIIASFQWIKYCIYFPFSEHRTKKLIETTNQTELNYTQTKVFIIDSGKSGKGLSDSDKICTINIPLVVSALVLAFKK